MTIAGMSRSASRPATMPTRSATSRGPIGTGIAGAVAVHWKPMVNGDPAFDLGRCAIDPANPLRSCLAMPLVADESLIAILAVYSSAPAAYSQDHARLLELVAARLAESLIDLAIIEEDLQPSQARPAPSLQLVKAAMPEAPPPDRPAAPAARGPSSRAATRRAASSAASYPRHGSHGLTSNSTVLSARTAATDAGEPDRDAGQREASLTQHQRQHRAPATRRAPSAGRTRSARCATPCESRP